MATKAKAGAGIKLKIGDGLSPEGFTAVAEIKTIKFPGKTLSTEDVTNMDSPADSNGVIFKEYIATVADAGDLEFTYNFTTDPTGGASNVRSAFNGVVHDWQIVFPELNEASPAVNRTFAFTGFVLTVDAVDLQTDKARTGTGKIKITGGYTTNW